MADDNTSSLQAGRTGLIARIPDAEPAVSAWRERFDPSAREGVPAHVTVLFPFLDENRIDAHVRSILTAVIGRQHAFDLLFESCERFPGVLYLAPVPDAQVRQLTEEITARWPEAPPYGGKLSEVVPHLTIADGPDDTVLDEIETSILPHLPIASRVSSVDLMVHDGARWQTRVSFPLLE